MVCLAARRSSREARRGTTAPEVDEAGLPDAPSPKPRVGGDEGENSGFVVPRVPAEADSKSSVVELLTKALCLLSATVSC